MAEENKNKTIKRVKGQLSLGTTLKLYFIPASFLVFVFIAIGFGLFLASGEDSILWLDDEEESIWLLVALGTAPLIFAFTFSLIALFMFISYAGGVSLKGNFTRVSSGTRKQEKYSRLQKKMRKKYGKDHYEE